MDFRKVAASAGRTEALAVLGLKTAAFPSRLAGSVMRDIGSHALSGAATGAIGGAMGAESGHRMEGALRGGAVGGALGGAIGAGNLGLMKARGARISDVLADKRQMAAAIRQRPEGLDHSADYKNIREIVQGYTDPNRALGKFHTQDAIASVANPVLTGAAGMSSQWGLGRDDQR